MANTNTREVWLRNKNQEMVKIRDCFNSCSFIAIDMEFPGNLKQTRMESSEEERYRIMRFNVGATKLIQFGFTLFDDVGRIGGTWEVNLSDFDVTKDSNNPKSIEFLRKNGLDLEKIRDEGISIKEFFKEFSLILNEKKKKMTWITFDGTYDLAYLVKGLTGTDSLPETSSEFAELVKTLLGGFHDVKKMSGDCKGLSSRFGLQRVADELQITRAGNAHHAGSDSELTARVFTKIALVLYREKRKRSESQHHDQKRMRFETEQHLVHMEQLRIHENYKRMHLEAVQQQQQQHLQAFFLPQPFYVTQPPQPMMFPAYHHPFGGHLVVPIPRMSYV